MASPIRTPYAAVKIWNFDDRISAQGTSGGVFNKINEEIISTVSLVSVNTSKAKSDPVGTFNFTLAPTRNWTAVLTPGSWCAILMSNNPITEDSLNTADQNYVKMVGRIDTVRVEVVVGGDGARQTRYLVSGQDWGSIFNNIIYVDPLVQDADTSQNQGNALYIQFTENVFGPDNSPLSTDVTTNLQTILSIVGAPLNLPKTTRLAKATHAIDMPQELVNYFNFVDGEGGIAASTTITKLITIVNGSLNKGKDDDYDDTVNVGSGWLDPFAMVGQRTLWSILNDNANYALNEMYPELFWSDNGPQLLLYNRVKPFSYQDSFDSPHDSQLRSKFQNVASHKLNSDTVISVNAGLNWNDKFNFAEIKPDINEFKIFDVVLKQKSQAYEGNGTSADVFNREGFKPIIFSIRQLPFDLSDKAPKNINDDLLQKWANQLQEWYFDIHRLLNGRIVMTGINEYIPVGDNIMFDAGLIGVTRNYNKAAGQVGQSQKIYVLAHVESIQHSFSINLDSRQYQTTIQFVRGIFVDESKQLIGEGTMDTLASSLPSDISQNSKTVVASSTGDAPIGVDLG